MIHSAQFRSQLVLAAVLMLLCSGLTAGRAAAAFDPSFQIVASPPTAGEPIVATPKWLVPTTAGQQPLDAVSMVFPAGYQVNAAALAGLIYCTDATLVTCPAKSQVASATVVTPAGTIVGNKVFLLTPTQSQRFRLGMAVGAPVSRAYSGQLTVDPVTARPGISFAGLANANASSVSVTLEAAAKLIRNTISCGGFRVEGTAASTTVAPMSLYSIGQIVATPCSSAPPPIGLVAGPTTIQSGAAVPFELTSTRDDNDFQLTSARFDLADGFWFPQPSAATCSRTDALANACAPATRLGTVTMNTGGAVEPPQVVSADLYAVTPAGTAAFDLAFSIPFKLGVIDLGTNTMFGKVIRPGTASGPSIVFDEFPVLKQGLPVGLTSLKLTLDAASQFAPLIAPGACGGASVAGHFDFNNGVTRQYTTAANIAGCESRQFRPAVTMAAAVPAGQTDRGMAMRIELPAGNASLARVTANLPSAFGINPVSSGVVCAAGNLDANSCPAESLIGQADLATPLFAAPLTGSVFLTGGGLRPTVAIVFPGNPDFRFSGELEQSGGLTTIKIDHVRDVPLATLGIELFGGSRGLVGVAECAAGNQTAEITVVSHSGQQVGVRALPAIDACVGAKKSQLPKVTVSSKGMRAKSMKAQAFSLDFKLPDSAPTITKLILLLPDGAKIAVARTRSHVAATAGRHKLGGRDKRPYGINGIELRISRAWKARQIALRSKKSAIQFAPKLFCLPKTKRSAAIRKKSLRQCSKRKIAFTIVTLDANGAPHRYNVSAPANQFR